MTHEVSRSQLFDSYVQHCSRFNPGTPAAAFPDYDLNFKQLLPADRSAAILDFGCGMGQFLAYLQDRNYSNVTGIDISRSQIDHCHSLGLTHAHHVEDSIAFLHANSGQFKVIVGLDVMEHLPKSMIIPIMQAIHTALQSGGMFIMRVPNIAAAIGPWTRYMDFTHEMSFDKRSIRQMLEMAHYKDTVIYPNQTYYRRKWLGFGFELVRSWLYMLLKGIYLLQSPGTENPSIFTIFIYGVGYKAADQDSLRGIPPA